MKLEVKNKAIDKSVEAATNFLGKLLRPAVDEIGLLLQDKVRMWRFGQQIKMLNKAEQYCIQYKINPKNISPKLLCPLLENASLEDKEELLDCWATLLGNMVDSEQNIENHVFPYILSQISLKEFKALNALCQKKTDKDNVLKKELAECLATRPTELARIEKEIAIEREKQGPVQITTGQGTKFSGPIFELTQELINLENAEKRYARQINLPIEIRSIGLEKFELANLTRLGLLKTEYRAYASKSSFDIPEEGGSIDFEVGSMGITTITELGELFFEACNAKRS